MCIYFVRDLKKYLREIDLNMCVKNCSADKYSVHRTPGMFRTGTFIWLLISLLLLAISLFDKLETYNACSSLFLYCIHMFSHSLRFLYCHTVTCNSMFSYHIVYEGTVILTFFLYFF